MSLAISIKSPEGIVFAAESRVSFPVPDGSGNNAWITFDNATKLISFKGHSYVGAVTYGIAYIGQRTAHSFLPEFLVQLGKDRLSVEEFSKKWSDFLMEQWSVGQSLNIPAGNNMVFIVGGFDEGEPHGKLYEIQIPERLVPMPLAEDIFTIQWGGQREIVDRLLFGADSRFVDLIKEELNLTEAQKNKIDGLIGRFGLVVPINTLALQDCVNLALALIRATIDFQGLTVSLRGVGGPIDIATITREDGLKYVQQKKITGERGLNG